MISLFFFLTLYILSVPLSLRTLRLIQSLTQKQTQLNWVTFVPVLNSALAVVSILMICSEELDDTLDLMRKMLVRKKVEPPFEEHA